MDLPDDCLFEILSYLGLHDIYSASTALNRKYLWLWKVKRLSELEAERMVGYGMKNQRLDLILDIAVCCPLFNKWKYLISQFSQTNTGYLVALFEAKPEKRYLLRTFDSSGHRWMNIFDNKQLLMLVAEYLPDYAFFVRGRQLERDIRYFETRDHDHTKFLDRARKTLDRIDKICR